MSYPIFIDEPINQAIRCEQRFVWGGQIPNQTNHSLDAINYPFDLGAYPETNEEAIQRRLERSEEIAEAIRSSGAHPALLEAHRTSGGRHPDDLYLPLNKWNETE